MEIENYLTDILDELIADARAIGKGQDDEFDKGRLAAHYEINFQTLESS